MVQDLAMLIDEVSKQPGYPIGPFYAGPCNARGKLVYGHFGPQFTPLKNASQ